MNGTQLEDEESTLTVRYAETPQQKQRRTSIPVCNFNKSICIMILNFLINSFCMNSKQNT